MKVLLLENKNFNGCEVLKTFMAAKINIDAKFVLNASSQRISRISTCKKIIVFSVQFVKTPQQLKHNSKLTYNLTTILKVRIAIFKCNVSL